jgi:hypothetical protein
MLAMTLGRRARSAETSASSAAAGCGWPWWTMLKKEWRVVVRGSVVMHLLLNGPSPKYRAIWSERKHGTCARSSAGIGCPRSTPSPVSEAAIARFFFSTIITTTHTLLPSS